MRPAPSSVLDVGRISRHGFVGTVILPSMICCFSSSRVPAYWLMSVLRPA